MSPVAPAATIETLRDALRALQAGATFSADETEALVRVALEEPDDAPLAAFIAALAQRRETGPEIAGVARALRSSMTLFDAGDGADCVDTCGTGGDGLGTFNLSTAAALVAAGAGVRVVKHGGRAVSSGSGSADVLEAAGGRVDVEPAVARRALDETGFTFLFAPRYHPAMKRAARVRRALGIRTVFNLAGPLCNPARVRRQVVGVAAPRFVGPVAEALEALGVRSALVVHGAGGADELTLAGPQSVQGVAGARASVCARLAGGAGGSIALEKASVADLAGGDARHNARLLASLLAGAAGPLLDATVLNAAAAIAVSDDALDDLDVALERARESIASGAAARVLAGWIRITEGAA